MSFLDDEYDRDVRLAYLRGDRLKAAAKERLEWMTETKEYSRGVMVKEKTESEDKLAKITWWVNNEARINNIPNGSDDWNKGYEMAISTLKGMLKTKRSREVWINVFEDDHSAWDSKEQADHMYETARAMQSNRGGGEFVRLACVKTTIEWEE